MNRVEIPFAHIERVSYDLPDTLPRDLYFAYDAVFQCIPENDAEGLTLLEFAEWAAPGCFEAKTAIESARDKLIAKAGYVDVLAALLAAVLYCDKWGLKIAKRGVENVVVALLPGYNRAPLSYEAPDKELLAELNGIRKTGSGLSSEAVQGRG